jgi:hypothetical protein
MKKRHILAALLAPVVGLAIATSASAATCDQLKGANAAVVDLVAKIDAGTVSPIAGLQAGMAELQKLGLSAENAAKMKAKTDPVVAKGAGATKAEVLALFMEARTDLGAEAAKEKCPA